MDSLFWAFIGVAIGLGINKGLSFIAVNVEYKKGFIHGYKKGTQETQMSNLKIQQRFDPFKSMIVTNHCFVPDSPDIDSMIMNQHRNLELVELKQKVTI